MKPKLSTREQKRRVKAATSKKDDEMASSAAAQIPVEERIFAGDRRLLLGSLAMLKQDLGAFAQAAHAQAYLAGAPSRGPSFIEVCGILDLDAEDTRESIEKVLPARGRELLDKYNHTIKECL